jgi:hypothetical protein
MYFIPADFAAAAQARASNFCGLNWSASLRYSLKGMRSFHINHSPRPGMAYTPQWMNMPNLASRHHCIPAGDRNSSCPGFLFAALSVIFISLFIFTHFTPYV